MAEPLKGPAVLYASATFGRPRLNEPEGGTEWHICGQQSNDPQDRRGVQTIIGFRISEGGARLDDIRGDIPVPGQHGNDYWSLAAIGTIFGNLPLECVRVPGHFFFASLSSGVL